MALCFSCCLNNSPLILRIPSSPLKHLRSLGESNLLRRDCSDRLTTIHLRRRDHSFKRFSQNQSQSQSEPELKFERLFSNLNQDTLKRDPGSSVSLSLDFSANGMNGFVFACVGSLLSAILLVAGTTVRAKFLST